MKKTFIILLNWNNAPDTIECLESLRSIPNTSTHIILVDNNSTDGSLEKIKKWTNDQVFNIHIISLKENRGFSGGNNAGMEYALNQSADYIMLLNNDTLVTPEFFSIMLKAAEKDKNIGIVGGLIRYFPEKNNIWFNGGTIDWFKGAFYHDHRLSSEIKESQFITGCLMLIRGEALKKSGGFDDQYFLNVEDVDLSFRIHQLGYRLDVESDSLIYHKVSRTIGGGGSKLHHYYFHRNRLLFFKKNLRGMNKYIFFTFQFLIAIPVWFLIHLITRQFTPVRGAWLGYKDFLQGQLGKSKHF